MLWVCEDCTARYSVDAPRCPQCGSTNHHEEGEMPKNTVHGGPSNAGLDVAVDSETGRQPLEVQRATDVSGTVETEADRAHREQLAELAASGGPTEEEGDRSSQPADQGAGTDCSGSIEKQPTSPSPEPTSNDTSAPTTGSHSAPDLADSGTAPSTATDSTGLPLLADPPS